MKKEKNDKLDKLLSSLKNDFNIKKASDIVEEEKIRTGIYALDYVLSGGLSQCDGGHRLEFFGAESTGKTTFALHIIKKYQELGKVCVFIDAENSYDKEWAEICGVDNDNILIINPKSLEEAGNLYVKLIPESDLIVTDSIVSLIPDAEIERNVEEATMALQARINALITRKIYQTIAGRKTTLIFINQLREKLGVMYGNPYTTGGGHAIKHMYNTRIEFKTGKPINVGTGDNKERIGIEIHLKGVKNKKGTPYLDAVVDFYFNGKIDNKKSIFFGALKYGIIQLSGKTYEYKDIKVVGKEAFLEKMDDKLIKQIEDEIWKKNQ